MYKLFLMLFKLARESAISENGDKVLFNKNFIQASNEIMDYVEKNLPSVEIAFEDNGQILMQIKDKSYKFHLNQFLQQEKNDTEMDHEKILQSMVNRKVVQIICPAETQKQTIKVKRKQKAKIGYNSKPKKN